MEAAATPARPSATTSSSSSTTTSSPISLNGLSVQYASSAGTSWVNLTVLPNVSVQPGHYFLIQEAEGTTVTNKPLPTADVSGNINLSATAGKVALVNGTAAIASGTSCPTGTTIIDLVGFGSANCFEGSGPAPGIPPAPTPSLISGRAILTPTTTRRTSLSALRIRVIRHLEAAQAALAQRARRILRR